MSKRELDNNPVRKKNNTMFDLSLTLNPNGAVTLPGTNADKVYDLVDFPNKGQSVRRVSASALSAPETLTISHRQFLEKGVPYTQHLVRIDNMIYDAQGEPRPYAAWLVIKRPGDTSVATPTLIGDAVLRLARFTVTSPYLARLLNGEP